MYNNNNNNNNNNLNIGDTRGYLDLDNYMISHDLHTSLVQETLVNNNNNIVNKDLDKFYMVMIKVFNKDSRSLVYNYISYSSLFYETFAYYFNARSSLIGNVYKEPSSLLTITDAIGSIGYIPEDKLYICKKILRIDDLDLSIDTYKYDITDLGIFRLINKLSLIVSIDHMSSLINLALDKNYKDFTKEVLSTIKGHEHFIKNVSNTHSINIIDSCLFVVGNLDEFVANIKNYGYNINTGSQKHRGHVNSIQNSLCMLDTEYRKSLYTHHRYHITKGNLDTSFRLNKDKFSFKNIHSNLGGVKWYSTKTRKTITLVNQVSASDHNWIYDQLAEYFKNLPINENTQKEVEELLLKYSKWFYTKKEEAKLKRENSKSLYIDYDLISKDFSKLLKDKKVIISDYIDNVRKRHYDEKPKKKNELYLYYLHNILKTVKTSYVISILYGRVLKIISTNEKLLNIESSICLELGRDLVKNYHFCLYENYKSSYENNNNNFYMSDWKKINNEVIDQYNDKDANFTCSIGAILAKWLLDVNILEEKWIRKGRKESVNILIPTEDLLNSLNNNKENTYYLPSKIPMIITPKPYYRIKLSNGHIKEHLGGYLLNDIAYTDEIIKQRWNNEKKTEIRDKNVIYDLVNNINSVGFKINTDVLDFINTHRYIYDLIDTDKDNFNNLLTKPKLNESEYKILESYLSKKVQNKNILGIAKAYSHLHEFFLPVRLDFRGRLNCVSEYLNYQGSELAKALLLFSKAEKINKTDVTATHFLKSYGANCFGNKLDKKSWNERANWVDDNINEIINFKNGNLIKQAENKLMFIAFCFEYNRFLDCLDNVNTTFFETHLPIRLDATCNGYQHIALLTLDTNLARELNLTKSSKNDTPKDYYSFIGTNLISLYKRKLKSPNLSDLDRDCYTRLSILDVIRKLLKGPIMITVYNATPFKIVDDLKKDFILVDDGKDTPYWERWYVYNKNDNIKLKERDFILIRDGIEEILSNNVFKIKKLMTYLEMIAKILAKLNLIIPWAAPNGVNIYQSYLATEEIRLKPFTYSKKTFTLTIPNKEGKISKTKQVRAFMPNLIHSLDAASLALLVDLYFNNSKTTNIKNIFTVHDCFGVTANNIENIMDLLKLVYTRIYSDTQYLRKLDRGIIDYIKLSYKDCYFDEEKLELHTDDDKIIKYPSIEAVLGTSSKGSDLIFDSSYIIH